MSTPDRLSQQDIRALTEARLTFGPRGRALDTATALQFSLDHAKAREAVLSELDVPRLCHALETAGLPWVTVHSAAETRDAFIKRPDLGRRLDPEAATALQDTGQRDVALVLGDGLSAIAVALNGAAFMTALAARLTARGFSLSPVVLARQARVALGDEIAQALRADTVVMALGERPGLSAADSLGVYITHHPTPATQDSGRNCISNIRDAGTQVQEAARQAEALILAMRTHGKSGVALSQEMAGSAVLPEPDAPGSA